MKKKLFLFFTILFLSGCATYRFHQGQPPYDKGYVVSRDDYTIVEYTLGENNAVPDDIDLAKQRFERRRHIVEHYYKRMGYIKNHFKMAVWDPGVFGVKMIGGVFYLPYIAISDYKYEHNPAYKERIKKIFEERDAKEEARINKVRMELTDYIQKDLGAEPE